MAEMEEIQPNPLEGRASYAHFPCRHCTGMCCLPPPPLFLLSVVGKPRSTCVCDPQVLLAYVETAQYTRATHNTFEKLFLPEVTDPDVLDVSMHTMQEVLDSIKHTVETVSVVAPYPPCQYHPCISHRLQWW